MGTKALVWVENDDWKSWLHYDIARHAAFRFTCIKATEQNLFPIRRSAFVFIRYKNWSKAATKGSEFDKHVKSDLHKEAYYRYHVAQDECNDIGDLLQWNLSIADMLYSGQLSIADTYPKNG